MARVTVLGGGLAGLSAAIYAAADGHDVRLIEVQPRLGGKAAQVCKDGYRFDAGPSVFTLKHVLEDVFAAAGKALPIDLTPLDLLCRYLFPSGRVLDVYSDVDKTTAQLSSAEAEVYRKLLAKSRELYEAAAPVFVYGPAPGHLKLLRYGLKDGLAAKPFSSLPQLLDGYGAEGDLKQFFLRFATYFGADPYRAPAVLHNIAYSELGQGVYYPAGGTYGVVRALAELARELGVDIKPRERAERIERRGDRVVALHTDQSSYADIDTLVSALDIVRTHELLGLTTRYAGLEPSLSGFVLLVGVEASLPDIKHHTISFSPDYAGEFAALKKGRFPPEPTLYINVSSKTDPNDAPRACENWFVMANAPALRSGVTLDEAAYRDEVLATLKKRGLLEPSQIAFAQTLGPSYLAQFAYQGSIYGHAPHSLLATLRPRPKVRGVANLILAGGTVHPGGGMPLALLSGKQAAGLIA